MKICIQVLIGATIVMIITILVFVMLSKDDCHKDNYDREGKNSILTLSNWGGRLGNQILSNIIAINYALENNFNIIKLPRKTKYCNTDIINLQKYTNVTTNYKSETIGPFWEHNFYKINLDKNVEIIKKIITSIYRLPKAMKPSDDNTLHIHIRGGDVEYAAKTMPQPPCQFYVDQIDKKKWDKIIIISEDKKNPCVDYILNRYENAQYNKNTLDEDISKILSAKYILIGRGTFIPLLTLFMPYIKEIHHPQDGDDRIHYFLNIFNKGKITIHNKYNHYYEMCKKIDKNNYKNLMKGEMITPSEII